ncbi:variable surface protein [Plasmodium gonderi]|uniref:Variable surface protein n=1 Tax=Plasmodium gonderi TaxID=77519 RepID=A0A1Y1JJP4_PLAGO|nr:variable surface protein [Plasmodium gonderi]GAW82729.1 variable surface protein [Plasmodium gonderi]
MEPYDIQNVLGEKVQTDTDSNGEQGIASVSISTIENENHKYEQCDKTFTKYVKEFDKVFPNLDGNNYTHSCKKCDEFRVYINNIERDLKECSDKERILIGLYQDEIKKCNERCARKSERFGSALSHVESTDELTSVTEKPSKVSKNQIESKKEDVLAHSEFLPQTPETVALETGKTQDETSNKSLRETELQQHDVSSSQHVVKPTSDSTENEDRVPESPEDSHPNAPEQMKSTEQSLCVSDNSLKGEPRGSNCPQVRISTQLHDSGEELHVNPLDNIPYLRNSDCATVEHKEDPLRAHIVEGSVPCSTHQGNANELGASKRDIGSVYTTITYNDRTHVGITVSNHGTSSDMPTIYVSLGKETTQVGGSRNATQEGLLPGSKNSYSSSISSGTHNQITNVVASTPIINGSYGTSTVEKVSELSRNSATQHNGTTGEGIVLDGSDDEQGIPYKNYMIMILVPLTIILIMTLLVKFTPLGMLFTKKKRKKRKHMNEKLQKVLLDRTPATETRVHLAYSYL